MPVTDNEATGAAPAGNEQLKKCQACGRLLPREAFFKHNKSEDGLMCECKECVRRRHEAKKNVSRNPLAQFTARQLMDELSRRGYKGELTYTEIKVHKMKLGEV